MGKAESQSKHVPTTQLNNIESKIDVILEDTSTTLEDKLDAIKLIVEAIPDFTTLEAKINEILEDTSTTLEEKIDALNVLNVAIEDKLDNATHGLAALKVLIDALEGKLDHASHGLAALKTLIDAVEGKLDHPSHGLANLKTLIDAVEGKLDHASHGLAALKTLIDAIETKLDVWPAERGTDNAELETAAATRYTALAGYVDEIESLLKDGTYGLSALETLVDEVESLLKNATYGLSALKTEIDANETKIDTVDTVVDAIKVQTDKLPRVVSHMDFWGDNDDEIALTTVSGSHNLPNVVVAGLPANITIIRVVALLKIAIFKDTSGADNAINSATMALKVDAASDYSSTVTAIDIPDNSWAVDVSEATERGGDAMIGDHDIKAEVTGNATFYGRFENAASDGNNLLLKDVAWGLRIYFGV